MTTPIVLRPPVQTRVQDAGSRLAHEMFGMAADLLDSRLPSGWESSWERANRRA